MSLSSANVERALLRLTPLEPGQSRSRSSIDPSWFFHLARANARRAPIPFCWGPHGPALLLGMLLAIAAAVLVAGSAFAADGPALRRAPAAIAAPQPSFFDWLFGVKPQPAPRRPVVVKAKPKAPAAVAKPPVAVGVSEVGKSPSAQWLATEVWPVLTPAQRAAFQLELGAPPARNSVVVRCERLECRRLAADLVVTINAKGWTATLERAPVTGSGITVGPVGGPLVAAAARVRSAFDRIDLRAGDADTPEEGPVIVSIGKRQ